MAPRVQRGLSIRLQRIGVRHNPVYNIVVVERSRRLPGRPTELLGTYDSVPRALRQPAPNLLEEGAITVEKRIEWNRERVIYWLAQGAEPSDRVRWMLKQAGIPTLPAAFSQTPRQARQDVAKLQPLKPDFDAPIPQIDAIRNPVEQATWRQRLRRAQRDFYLKTFEPGMPDWIEREAVKAGIAELKAADTLGQVETFPSTSRPLHPTAEPSAAGSRLPNLDRVRNRTTRRAAAQVSIIPADARSDSAKYHSARPGRKRKLERRKQAIAEGTARAIARKAALQNAAAAAAYTSSPGSSIEL